MDTYGLIGKKLGHSFSKKYFEETFEQLHLDATYQLFELEKIDDIHRIFAIPTLKGFNVTVPYKISIIPFLDNLSEAASETQSVNCVKIEDKKKIGYNTDVLGFEYALLHNFLPLGFESKALILGDGGASRSVQHVLKKLHIDFEIIARNNKNSLHYDNLNAELIQFHQLIIQTTPVGMYPSINETIDFPFQYLSSNHYVMDLIYNPTKTKLLQAAESQGSIIKNGLEMLYKQADMAWNIWK